MKKTTGFIKKYLTIFAGMAFIFAYLAIEYVVDLFLFHGNDLSAHWLSGGLLETHERIIMVVLTLAFSIYIHFLMVRNKTIEALAKENERRYQELFTSMTNGFALHRIVVDGKGLPVDYVVLEVNSSFERMTGLKRENIIGRRVTEVLPDIKKDDFDWIGTYGRVALNNENIQFEQYSETLGKWYNITAYSPSIGEFATVLEDISERKKIENVVRENQERLDTIFNSIQVGIMVIDREAHSIAFVNQAAVKMIGATREQLLDQPCQKYVCSAACGECPITDMGQKVDNSERVLLTADGRQLPILKTVVEAELEGRPVLVESFVDISERKRAEKTLLEIEIKYRELFDNASDAIIIADTETAIILDANQAAETLLGRPKQEIIGKNRSELHPAGKTSKHQEEFRLHINAGHVTDMESEVVRKDGTVVPVRISAKVSTVDGRKVIQGIFRDITEQKAALKRIEKVNRQIKLILDSVGEGIYGLDDQGKTIFINPAGAQLLGYQPEELLGKVQHDLSHHTKPDGSSYLINDCPVHASFIDGNVHHVTGEIFWRKDGSSFPVEYISAPIAEEGKNNGSVVVFRNVAERKQAEALQSAIYKISEISTSAGNLLELYAGIHMVVDELMNTANFYIALYNEKENRLEFPYFVDERDPSPVSRPLKKGLTEYVLRTRKPLLAPPLIQKKLVDEGEVEIVGTPSVDWMGVPLNIGKNIFGVLVVQSYRGEVRFGARELTMLNFVSGNIAAAIQRKKSGDEREKLVGELQESVNNIKTLKGLIPICASCKKIRNDGGYWQQVEEYVAEHTEADFSHGLCDECAHKLYPDYFPDKKNDQLK